jgi:hypothetical protein
MTAPLKVEDEADVLATQSAHFLGMTKKRFVSEAIAVYSETRRADIERGVREALGVLDGTLATAVSVHSGLSPERIAELGGL